MEIVIIVNQIFSQPFGWYCTYSLSCLEEKFYKYVVKQSSGETFLIFLFWTRNSKEKNA